MRLERALAVLCGVSLLVSCYALHRTCSNAPAGAFPSAAPPPGSEDIKTLLPGCWQTRNVGLGKSGLVVFLHDGRYAVMQGYFEAGGSAWLVRAGHYAVPGGPLVAFRYPHQFPRQPDVPGLGREIPPFSRLALLIGGDRNHLVFSTQGETHAVEFLDRLPAEKCGVKNALLDF